MTFRLLKFWPFALGMLLIVALNRAEYMAAPVVKNFAVESWEHKSNGVLMSGSLRKVRDCAFVGLLATSQDGSELGVQFLDRGVHNSTRPTGSQGWGPWQIYLPITPYVASVRLTSVHRCHPFWTTETLLAELPITQPPKANL